MKVTVDPDLCVGNGVCEALAPGLFIVAQSGEVELQFTEIRPGQEQLVQEAVDSCPARALSFDHRPSTIDPR